MSIHEQMRETERSRYGRKILEIEGITKKYKDFKLEPVSFSLKPEDL